MSALDTLIRICDKTGISPSRRNELGEWMGRVDSLMKRMDLSSAQGTPDAPYFPVLKWGQAFGEILPNECAILYQGTEAGSQVIDNNTWTNFTTFDSPKVGIVSGASRELGLKVDHTTGQIFVTGTPRQSVVLWYFMTYFPSNATGLRGVAMLADDSSARQFIVPALNGNDTMVFGVHLRSTPSSGSWYRPQVYQNSGGQLTIAALSSLHAVVRIR